VLTVLHVNRRYAEIESRTCERPKYSIPSNLVAEAVQAYAECFSACALHCVPVAAVRRDDGEQDETLQLAI
jgi:hypothetical protein